MELEWRRVRGCKTIFHWSENLYSLGCEYVKQHILRQKGKNVIYAKDGGIMSFMLINANQTANFFQYVINYGGSSHWTPLELFLKFMPIT